MSDAQGPIQYPQELLDEIVPSLQQYLEQQWQAIDHRLMSGPNSLIEQIEQIVKLGPASLRTELSGNLAQLHADLEAQFNALHSLATTLGQGASNLDHDDAQGADGLRLS